MSGLFWRKKSVNIKLNRQVFGRYYQNPKLQGNTLPNSTYKYWSFFIHTKGHSRQLHSKCVMKSFRCQIYSNKLLNNRKAVSNFNPLALQLLINNFNSLPLLTSCSPLVWSNSKLKGRSVDVLIFYYGQGFKLEEVFPSQNWKIIMRECTVLAKKILCFVF